MTISRSQMNKELKKIPAGNKGLKKLSPEVRNQIGFMSKGGTVMKSKGGAVKMSKGGAVKMSKGGAVKMSKGGAVKMSKGGAVKMSKGGAIKKMKMGGRVGGLARRKRAR